MGVMSRRRAPRRALWAVTALLLLAPVAGCSGGGLPRSTGSDTGGATAPAGSGATEATSGSAQSSTAESGGRGGQAATGLTGRPSAEQLSAARADVARLSVPQLAAQLVVPRQRGAGQDAAAALRSGGYGGYAVFRDNLPQGAAAVRTARADNAAFERAMRESGRDWPAFVSIDQEGGPVTRLDSPLTLFPAVMALGAAGDPGLARRVGAASGAELRGLGYTVVLAPVADVTVGEADPTIGVRSPGSDPRAVSRISSALAAGYLDAGILPTLKHFPGHGGVGDDSHLGTVTQRAPLSQMRERDLLPFAEAVSAGAPAIMTAHIVLTSVDPQRPSTVSQKVLTGVLREDLGFTGLVVTDALEMAAVASRFGAGQAAVEAVRAGADVLLMPADAKAAVTALVKAVDDGSVTRGRLEESAARMVATLRAAVHDPPAPSEPGSHQQVAKDVAAAAITQLGGECGARLVGDGIRVSGGDAADREALTTAARAAGLRTGSGTSVVLRGGSTYRAAEDDGESTASAPATGDVVVALDAPYTLARDRARVAKLATFGRTPATFAELVRVLLGERTASGALPVAVGNHAIGSGCGRSS